MNTVGPQDYNSLARQEINNIVDEYRYHPQVLQWVNDALALILTHPQDAYESVIQFREFDLKQILDDDLSQIDRMFDFLETLFPDMSYIMPSYKDVEAEFEEILMSWCEEPRNEITDIKYAAELDEFYHNRVVPLSN